MWVLSIYVVIQNGYKIPTKYRLIQCIKKIFKIAAALSLLTVGNVFAQSNLYSDVPEGAEAVSLIDGRALTMPDATNETVSEKTLPMPVIDTWIIR